MKKYFALIIALFAFGLVSCEKETEGISFETQFPILTMKGNRYVGLPVGSTYTDAGVTAKAGTEDIQVKVTGQVNTAVQGVYTLVYTATNKDGYNASLSRTVAVATPAADAAANDLSGNYARNTNASVAEWKKLAPGIYSVFNPGGAPGTNLTVVVFNLAGSQIKIPQQTSSDGSITSSTSESYDPIAKQYLWAIVNPGYGTAVRTFVKQVN